MSLWQRNLFLILVAVLLAVGPLAFLQGAEWGGADMQSVDAVTEIQSDYQPWFEPIFSPAEMERWFFGFQALIGAALVSAFIGWMIGRRHAQVGKEGNERKIAMVISAVGVILAIGLFFVETEFGEIQAFISAVQGLGAGSLGFFGGYPLGRQAGARTTARAGSYS